MLHIGQYTLTTSRILAVLGLIAAVLFWANVAVGGLPIIAVAMVLLALAILL